MFQPVEQQPDLVALERRVLARWQEQRTFARSLEQRASGPLWRFYEGPPTANGKPGVHHVEARVFKDIFPRYRTMKGWRVPRRAGWDCHGIPVELEVERKLGFTRKQDIEDYGVEAFNALCRESVQAYVQDWNRLTERIGFWVDLDDAYWTMSPAYIESVWWSLKSLWDAGLLYEGHRVVPYCPRCGTPLSDHEVAQGYARAIDPSVHVRFPLLEGALADEGAALLVWTTTPWTLLSNTAAAVGPDVDYVLARRPGDEAPLVLARERVAAVLGDDAEVLRPVRGAELEGLHYRAPFDHLSPADGRTPTGAEAADWRYVTVQDFAVASEGTGIVHLAPAFGADDYQVAVAHGLPVVNPVDAEGRFDARITEFAGRFVKEADPDIVALMSERGLVVSAGTYEHSYPFCWRCGTPLLYYAMPSWYVATTKLRDRLLEVNAGVDWHPGHIRDGRYGDWLANNVDWALSRTRYWGTPLPLWRCGDCSEVVAVGSRAELGDLAGADLSALDPHRPFVDGVTFPCPACQGTMRRVPDVIDAWYDSGSMPFAQIGYPHAPGSEEAFGESFPADYICEAIDQTRGWFYSLMAIATLLFDRSSYRTVLCLGHLVDADGRKMSKSVGNVIDPWDIVDRHGADPLRWLLLVEGSPWGSRRVGHGPVEEVVRRFLLTLWNSYYFFVTYARIDGWAPGAQAAPAVGERPVMDRWILAELAATVTEVDDALAAFDATGAGRALQRLVDDLSNWYIRRTRGRFWADGTSADKLAAFATLHEVLVTVAALLAPFMPFLADELYANLVGSVESDAPDSVHLLDFPVADAAAADPTLRRAMAVARRVVELGRRARNDAAVPTRQPLPRALVTVATEDRALFDGVAAIVAEELNVRAVELAEAGGPVSVTVKPNFRALGRTFGKRTPSVADAVRALDGEEVAVALAAGQSVTVVVDGQVETLTAEMLVVTEEAREGWQVASDAGTSVALDLAVDDALRRDGLARELARAVNDLRKAGGLALSDRIRLRLGAGEELAAAVAEHRDRLMRDTLAVEVELTAPVDDATAVLVGGHRAWVALEVAA